jgi:hypothetical protein
MAKQNNEVRLSRLKLICVTLSFVVFSCVFTACHSDPPPAPPVSRPRNPDLVKVADKDKKDSDNIITLLKTIRNAQASNYAHNNGKYGTFDQLVRNQTLPRTFLGEKPVIMNYAFTLKFTQVNNDYDTGAAYTVNADPVDGRGSHFFLDKQHVIHSNDKQAASETDPVFEEKGQ